MLIWTLYCHIHIESGRRYIGLTKSTMMRRWNRHVYCALRSRDSNWHFPNAIRKYGKEAFSHEVLCQSWTLEGANTTEEELILQYDTRNPEKGFNIARGGGSKPNPIKNPWNRPEYRLRRTEQTRILWKNPVWASKTRAAIRATLSKPEVKTQLEAASRLLHSKSEFIQAKVDRWKDPIFREKCSIGLKIGAAKLAERTHCNQGHKLTSDNIYITQRGRKCKQCTLSSSRVENPYNGLTQSEATTEKWKDPIYKEKCLTNQKLYFNSRPVRIHCKHGHEFTSENTRITHNGRECKICCKARLEKHRKKEAAWQ